MNDMSLDFTLDLAGVDEPLPRGDFELIPAGEYTMLCEEFAAEQRDWGVQANIRFQITEGDYAGRVVFQRFPIIHNSKPDGQAYGQGMLAQWCAALGVENKFKVNDVPMLHKTVRVKLSVRKGKMKTDGSGEKWPDQNNVDKFLMEASRSTPAPRPAATKMTPTATPKPQTAAPAPAAKAMPWQK